MIKKTERVDEVPDIHIKLGDMAKDMMSGLEGRVTIINVPLHGAVRVSIDPLWDKKEKKNPEAFFVDAPFGDVTEAWDNRPKAETKPSTEQKKKKKEKPGACRMPSERNRTILR